MEGFNPVFILYWLVLKIGCEIESCREVESNRYEIVLKKECGDKYQQHKHWIVLSPNPKPEDVILFRNPVWDYEKETWLI